MMHFLIFDMLGSSQIVTHFNALWSHNFAYNCDHATFNVDCCYDILQQLLLICMSTKASVIFLAINHPTMSNFEILYSCLRTSVFCRSFKAVVLYGEE